MMVLSVLCLNIAHPGMVFGKESGGATEISYTGVNVGTVETKYMGSSSE